MKASKVLIAAVMALTVASVAKAAEGDLPGAYSKAVGFANLQMSAGEAGEYGGIPMPEVSFESEPSRVAPSKRSLRQLEAAGYYLLKNELSARTEPGMKAALVLLEDKDTSVLYDAEKIYFGRTGGDKSFLVSFESSDGKLLAITRKSEGFPAFRPSDTYLSRRCVSWGTEEVCINQQVCRVVAVAGGAAAGGVGGAVAGQIVSETICEWIPKCSTVRVCLEWEVS